MFNKLLSWLQPSEQEMIKEIQPVIERKPTLLEAKVCSILNEIRNNLDTIYPTRSYFCDHAWRGGTNSGFMLNYTDYKQGVFTFKYKDYKIEIYDDYWYEGLRSNQRGMRMGNGYVMYYKGVPVFISLNMEHVFDWNLSKTYFGKNDDDDFGSCTHNEDKEWVKMKREEHEYISKEFKQLEEAISMQDFLRSKAEDELVKVKNSQQKKDELSSFLLSQP